MGNVCGAAAAKQGLSESTNAASSRQSALRAATSADTSKSSTTANEAVSPSEKGAVSKVPSSIQSVKDDKPGAISIRVAPAPPPDEFPEIKAAVAAAQKEVKAGAKLKFTEHYRLGQVVGTGHYARVQLAMSLKDGKKYAVKILKKQEGREALLQQLQGETPSLQH